MEREDYSYTPNMPVRSSPTPHLVELFKPKLQAFVSSSAQFQVLHTLPKQHTHTQSPNVRSVLYVLDSSFNPPTKAHYRIASSALASHHPGTARRLLLLLAIQNADKAPKPESFEQRLAMMTCFAQDILLSNPRDLQEDDSFAVDIGVTKLPYFTDKSRAISESTDGRQRISMEQVHLIGFDTIRRILDPKYYPPDHNLRSLVDLFQNHRFRCTYRTDDGFGSKEEQDAYINALASGKRAKDGADSEWAQRIELVEGRQDGEEIISSTKVREAVARGDKTKLHSLCTDSVADWVWCEDLYNPNGKPDAHIQETRRLEGTLKR